MKVVEKIHIGVYIGDMKKEICNCSGVVSDRIGEVFVPSGSGRFVLGYRFFLDCPVHGIRTKVDGEWTQREAPMTKEEKEAARVARNKEIKKERRLKRMAKKKQDEKKRIK